MSTGKSVMKYKKLSATMLSLLFCLSSACLLRGVANAQKVSSTQDSELKKQLEESENGLATARKTADEQAIGYALQLRGRALRLSGRMKDSADSFLEAAKIWDKLKLDVWRVAARGGAANVLAKLEPERSKALMKEAFKIAESDSKEPLISAQTLHDIGLTAESMGLMEMSEEYFSHGLAIRDRTDPNSLDAAWSHKKLGDLAWNKKDRRVAETQYRLAMQIREKAAPETEELAWVYSRLGSIAKFYRDNKLAKPYFAKALAMRKKILPGSEDVASSALNLAFASEGALDPREETTRYFDEAIATYEKLSPISENTVRSLSFQAQYFRSIGDFTLAISSMRRVLAINERRGDKVQVAYNCYELGSWALDLGDLPIAEFYDRKGIALEEKREPIGQLMRWLLGDRASTLSRRGEYEEAELVLRRVVDMPPLDSIAPPDSTYPERAYMDIGAAYLELGRLAEGEQAFLKAQEIILQAEKNQPRIWHLPEYLLNERFGDLAFKKGDFKTAAAKYEEAYKPFAGHDEVNPANILILIKLATATEKTGRFSRTDELLNIALTEASAIAPDSALMASALFAAADIRYSRHDLEGAAQRYQEAWNLMQRQLDSGPSDQSRVGSSASSSEYAEPLIRTQVELGRLEAAFLTLEQSRAQTLRKLLTERRMISMLQPSHQMEIYRLAATAHSVAIRNLSGAISAEAQARDHVEQRVRSTQTAGLSKDQIEENASLLTVAKAEYEASVKAVSAARPFVASSRIDAEKALSDVEKNDSRLFAEPVAIQQARRSLSPGTLFIAFSSSDHETMVFLVEGGSPVVAYGIKINANELNERIVEFKKLVSARTSSEATIGQLGRALFQSLFPTEAATAIKNASRLLISPDGPLWDVPFAALVTNTSGPPEYLGLQKPMAFTQSLTVYSLLGANISLPTSANSLSRPLKAAIVGDPIFSTKGEGQELNPALDSNQPLERAYLWGGKSPPLRLPGTRVEATRIATLYHATPLLGADATESALRRLLVDADVIHLATHGFTNPANPLASGILLTPPSGVHQIDSKNDGALQTWEIFGGIRLKADLAVLSACETGVGRKIHGEGVIGLTRALQYAGVRSILASQWKVADASTGELMAEFHRKLLAGVVKDEALRASMQAVQRAKTTSHPSFWAAFFLTGDAGALRSKSGFTSVQRVHKN